MTDTLLDNGSSLDKWLTDLITVFGFGDLQSGLVNGQGICMYGCLRYQAIGKWEADNATNEACAAEKEEVPVETSGLLEGVLAGLCCER